MALLTELFPEAYSTENSEARHSYPSKHEAIWFDDASEPVPPGSPKGATPYPHRIHTGPTPDPHRNSTFTPFCATHCPAVTYRKGANYHYHGKDYRGMEHLTT